MDIPNSTMQAISPRWYNKLDERRRDTIMIRERKMTEAERKKWLGAPPTPVPETDRNFRPETLKF